MEMNEQKRNTNMDILFAKVQEGARIPEKRKSEDGGWDVWGCIPDDKVITLYPGQVKRIPTGIISAFSEEYVVILKERGSTGTKGMGIRCSVMDSGFRDEWYVPIQNTNQNVIIHIGSAAALDRLKRELDREWIDPDLQTPTEWKHIFYDTSKAICQFLLIPVPTAKVKEVSKEEVLAVESIRKENCLGSTNL